jgi:hypothetical protein
LAHGRQEKEMKDNKVGWTILTVLVLIAVYVIFKFLGTLFWYAVIGLFIAGVLFYIFKKSNRENK